MAENAADTSAIGFIHPQYITMCCKAATLGTRTHVKSRQKPDESEAEWGELAGKICACKPHRK